MKTTLIFILGILIVLGVYVVGVRNGRHEGIRFVSPTGDEKYVESSGRALYLLLRPEGIYCGSHLIAPSKEMEEIDGFVIKHKAGAFYIVAGGDDVKYGDFARLTAQLYEKYHFRITTNGCYVPPNYRMPEAAKRHWFSDDD